MSDSRCDKSLEGGGAESPVGCGQLRRAVDAAGIGLWRWDGHARQVTLDARSCELHGLEYRGNAPWSWSELLERVHPEDHDTLLAAWNQASEGDFRELEYRCVSPEGATRWVSCSGSYLQDVESQEPSVFGICFDVTKRKSVHQQLMLAQKVEAVGQLTAGISHNFNNLLTAIIPNLQMASRHQTPGGEKFLRNATLAAERASDLVAELMVVAGRREGASSEALDLGLIVERVVRICKTTFGSWVQLSFEDDSTSNTILGNEGHIEQVLLNILLNARDAFETATISSPSIRVELESVDAGAEGPRRLLLRVSDNGPGMGPEVLERIFEPFFTTKGTGTGLGLATAYAIVSDHEGMISCQSSPEHGTHFEVVLPLYEGEAQLKAPAIAPTFVGGTETILVVDDDDLVRRVTIAALEDAGYQVTAARGGNEAIAAQSKESNFDLVVLDLSMPELTGDQVLGVMRGRNPRIKVLVFTGLTDGRVSRLEDVAVLHKPAGVNDLLQAVRQAIDSQQIN